MAGRTARDSFIPTRLPIQWLEPCGNGVSAWSCGIDIVSDTENHVQHFTAFAGPHRRIYARFVSKIADVDISGRFVPAIPSLIPSRSFERGPQ
jgi:hypothetical protein